MNASSEKKGNRNCIQSSFVIFKCAWLFRVRAFKLVELTNEKLQVTGKKVLKKYLFLAVLRKANSTVTVLESKLNMWKKYLAISNFTYFVLDMICPVLPV